LRHDRALGSGKSDNNKKKRKRKKKKKKKKKTTFASHLETRFPV